MNSDDRLSNLKNHCEFLANPKLNGRVPGHEGNRLARNYIQQQFEAIGLTPLFDRNWYQEYPTQASGKAVMGVNVGGTLRAGVPNLSAMTGQDIAPHRPTLDALVSEIKSTYLGRSD